MKFVNFSNVKLKILFVISIIERDWVWVLKTLLVILIVYRDFNYGLYEIWMTFYNGQMDYTKFNIYVNILQQVYQGHTNGFAWKTLF